MSTVAFESDLTPARTGRVAIRLQLRAAEIHVWSARLDRPRRAVRTLAGSLSADEQVRAGQFRFEADRRRFVVSHGVLRALLGGYLNVAPDRVTFRSGPQGKPELARDGADDALRFNMAHSGELALFAFTRGCEVGVDVEWIQPIPQIESIARRFFSAHERAALFALPPQDRCAAFHACWTRKEAYLKAIGTGLAAQLDEFDVTLHPDAPPRILEIRGLPGEAEHWSIHTLTPRPGYAAAIAVRSRNNMLACREWREFP